MCGSGWFCSHSEVISKAPVLPQPLALPLSSGLGWVGLRTVHEALVPCSYLVMPFMQTDLQKIMGMEFSEDKIQYLVYQMLKGLKVGGALEDGREVEN